MTPQAVAMVYPQPITPKLLFLLFNDLE